MITSPYHITSMGPVRVNRARSYAAPTTAQAGHGPEKFDQVTLSAREGEDSYKIELQSKLSQEVRTATTTGTLAALREQVQSGAYQVDADSIAKKMLLLGEV